VLLGLVRYSRFFQLIGLPNYTLPLAFILKFFIGFLFNIIHEYTYGFGDLSHDGSVFMLEASQLNAVFYKNPSVYFKFLFGIDDSTKAILEYLPKTTYWNSGDLTLINDNKNIIRIHSIIQFFSMNQIYIHVSIMSLLTLYGIKNLYNSFVYHVTIPKMVFFWSLFLIPSTLFWTSSILKEPMLFLGFSLLIKGILYDKIIWKKIVNIVLSILLLVGFKPYIFVCILIAFVAWLIYRFIFNFKFVFTLISSLIVLVLLGSLFSKQRATVVNYLTRKQFDFVNVGKGGLHVQADTCFYYFQPYQYENLSIQKDVVLLKPCDAYVMRFGSTQRPKKVHLNPTGEHWKIHYYTKGCLSFIETTPINNSVIQLIKNIPEALTNSILRPFPTDHGSYLIWLSIFETWAILYFMILAIIKRRNLSNQNKGLVFALGIFALSLFLLIGFTTPVLGAMVRYRFPAQLALILIGIIIIDTKKLKTWKTLFL
jgi:hypothetical protein